MNWGGFAGLLVGAGATLIYCFAYARRVRLTSRVAPYLRSDNTSEAAIHSLTSTQIRAENASAKTFTGAITQLTNPLVHTTTRSIIRHLSLSHELSHRLQRAGSTLSASEFRAQQVLWAAGGLLCSLLLTVPALTTGRISALPAAAGTGLFIVGAFLLRDWLLTRKINQRDSQLMAELPTIAELLALAVSAGEPPLAALERVSRRAHGELAVEIRAMIHDIHAGATITTALSDLAARTEVAAVSRFADTIATAIERGTPLAAVLQDQAVDARDEARRHLMEQGGKKEISMLVPVVFFILPITVLFAIYPSFSALEGGL